MDKDKIDACLAETRKHIWEVGANINIFIRALLHRAEKHDQSKLEEPELSIFAEHTPELAKTVYGSPEYKEMLERVKPAIEHHYANNLHHPEAHLNGIDDMTLVDLIEMLSDWRAAGKRNKNGNIRKSIEVNAERFRLSPQLKKILENTVKEYFNE